MEIKRKVAGAVVTVSIALGIGHVMQGGWSDSRAQGAILANHPTAITPLAAGLTPELSPAQEPRLPPILPDTAFQPTPAAPAPLAVPMGDPLIANAPLSGDKVACPITLDVLATPQAMLDITLLAPCRANERIVLRHGGLVFSARTSVAGSVFVQIPGMDQAGEVTALFGDGHTEFRATPLRDLPLYQRFAVQWQVDDSFQLQAYENGASFGAEGHISAAHPQRRQSNIPTDNGFMTVLGDDSVELPMLAEVYTYPTRPGVSVDIAIEAQITAATCDRELLGEVLFSTAGRAISTDLTLATPTCDAIGDVLVLNNPLPDLKLAAAN